MEKLSLAKIGCLILVFCAATAIGSPAQSYTLLYSFCSQTNCADGANAAGALVQGTDGNLYGTTIRGGTGVGTVYKISAAGTLTSLHSFNDTDGLNPYAGLLLGSDGNFYGTTPFGGNLTLGNVFKMTPSGTVSQVYSFCPHSGCADGANPYGALVQGADGNFYGTAQGGGNGSCSGISGIGCGVVFKVTAGGTLTVLHAFVRPEGADPYGGLVQGADGNFYGTTQHGGTGNNNACIENSGLGCGTVFKITPSGALTTLYNFCSLPNCADGYGPYAGLVQTADGNFYGTAHWGGTGTIGNGTVFRISPTGALTTLHSFTGYPHDGAHPIGGLLQASDGNLYGTAAEAGVHFTGGTIFQMSPGGAYNTLYSFCALSNCDDGSSPSGALFQATDGNIYGATSGGGTGCNGSFCGYGVVFKLTTGLTPFVTLQPTSGLVGSTVTILGTNLSGATNVSFNGTPATILTNTGTAITTTVPAGATTGNVQVSVPGRTLISDTDFQVLGPIQLVPVTPCRLVDTRLTGGPIPGGTARNFTVPQLAGCGSGIPASAAAYALNVTVVPHGPLGYLTIWPQGEIQPLVSTMNSTDGRVKANAAIVPAANNAVSVYVSDTTDVILDINGYFAAPGVGTLQFYQLPPCRIVDTRNNMHGGTLRAGTERDYTIPTNCGVPRSAQAYSFNITVIPTHGELDYLTVWPKGVSRPTVSTLNDPTGTVVANAAIVPAGTQNATAFYAHDNPTDLLIDVNGYFAPAGSGGLSLYSVTPCRVLDTRAVGSGQPFQGVYNSPDGINVLTSPCGPPSTAKAFVFNATVVPPSAMPFLTLWPHGTSQPTVSTLNAYDGFITSNMAIVPSNDGSINAYADALTQLILDISGYFAP